jgi:hypothetical protein
MKTSDKILSIAAIFISICTLFVFLYQTNLIRKQHYGTNTENYKFILENKGIGPAIIKSIEVKTTNGELFKDINPYLNSRLQKTDTISFYHTDLSEGMLISANEKIELIKLNDQKLTSSLRLSEIL